MLRFGAGGNEDKITCEEVIKMLRKILIIAAVGVISVFCLSGCKKSSNEAEVEQEEVIKTMAEYEAEAEKEINEENVDAELEKIEKELEEEIAAEE